MSPLQALILGAVEGLTEFLPVSSTGHLILVSHRMGLSGEALKTFEIVIQAGALVAVAALYRDRLRAMAGGLLRAEPAGWNLLCRLAVSFVPAAVAGVALHAAIKQRLFSIQPVIAALAVGGVFMIGLDRWLKRRNTRPAVSLEQMTWGQALGIGLAQVFSLWPGTSRSMTTVAAGLIGGLSPVAAAEYSFLLALPTLGAATLFDAVHGGVGWVQQVGPVSLAVGFFASAGTAVLAVKGFVRWLTRRGLAPFGWYRLGLAVWILADFFA